MRTGDLVGFALRARDGVDLRVGFDLFVSAAFLFLKCDFCRRGVKASVSDSILLSEEEISDTASSSATFFGLPHRVGLVAVS